MQTPMLGCPKTTLELSEKTNAVSCGGLAVVQQMVRKIGLADAINRRCPIFKMHMPYTEADHVLNIAFAQGKAMGALSAPLHDLESNWAYIAMGMLAWNLKCWLSLLPQPVGNGQARAKRREQSSFCTSR